jgi:hypothetical protein
LIHSGEINETEWCDKKPRRRSEVSVSITIIVIVLIIVFSPVLICAGLLLVGGIALAVVSICAFFLESIFSLKEFLKRKRNVGGSGSESEVRLQKEKTTGEAITKKTTKDTKDTKGKK